MDSLCHFEIENILSKNWYLVYNLGCCNRKLFTFCKQIYENLNEDVKKDVRYGWFKYGTYVGYIDNYIAIERGYLITLQNRFYIKDNDALYHLIENSLNLNKLNIYQWALSLIDKSKFLTLPVTIFKILMLLTGTKYNNRINIKYITFTIRYYDINIDEFCNSILLPLINNDMCFNFYAHITQWIINYYDRKNLLKIYTTIINSDTNIRAKSYLILSIWRSNNSYKLNLKISYKDKNTNLIYKFKI